MIKNLLSPASRRSIKIAGMFAVMALSQPALWAGQASGSAESGTGVCADLPHSDHPKAVLSNGKLEAVVFLPDEKTGYYRSTRFDWAGVVGCVSLNGHKFFGEWFAQYDPLKNDSIVGPVEEFRTDAGPMGHTGPRGEMFVQPGAIGYADAKPGEPFLKPGVGVLKKVDDKPYAFGFPYPIIDTGKWTVKTSKRSVTFKQVLKGPNGYAYEYEKTLSLDKDGTTMTLEHSLKNTGTKVIDTQVYDHDFFAFDGQPTAAGMVVHFPFEPKPADPFGAAAKIEGKDLIYVATPGRGTGVQGYITGYSDKASDYDFIVENKNTKVGVEQTSDTPLSRLYFWSTGKVVCPEGYVHLNILPGKTSKWALHYRFFAPQA